MRCFCPKRAGCAISAGVLVCPALAAPLALRAGRLSGGEQQMTAIAPAPMTDPKLMLANERSARFAATIVPAVFQIVPLLPAQGANVRLATQGRTRGLSAADRAGVRDHGPIVLCTGAADHVHDRRGVDTDPAR